MATVFERVRAIVADKMGKDPEEITEQSILKPDKPDEKPSPHSLETDSLDIVEIIMAVEQEFSIPDHREIKISDDDYKNVQAVGLLVAWLKKRGVRDDER